MGFVPNDAEWYVAELIQELLVADDPRNMVWRNLTLVQANTPDEAYGKAQSLGEAGETEYLNPAGKHVTIRFRGLSLLDVIHDPLGHGAELLFHSQTHVPEEEVLKLLRSKEELGVFLPIRPLEGPDVASADVVREAESVAGVRRTATLP